MDFRRGLEDQECSPSLMPKTGQSAGLNIHVGTHSVKKAFLCSFCGKAFSLKRYLVQHEKIHSEVRPFRCSACGKTFHHKGNCDTHLKTHDDGKEPPRTIDMRTPKVKPSGKKRFVCDFCGKELASKENLDNHFASHYLKKTTVSMKNDSKCSVCGRVFMRAEYLRKHMNEEHSEDRAEKPFQSNVSEQMSTENLVKPITPQSEEKPCRCSVCGKLFISSDYLMKHMKQHSGFSARLEIKAEPNDDQIGDLNLQSGSVENVGSHLNGEYSARLTPKTEPSDGQFGEVHYKSGSLNRIGSHIEREYSPSLIPKTELSDNHHDGTAELDLQCESASEDHIGSLFNNESSANLIPKTEPNYDEIDDTGLECRASSKCLVCGRVFVRAENLRKHMKDEHSDICAELPYDI